MNVILYFNFLILLSSLVYYNDSLNYIDSDLHVVFLTKLINFNS